MITINDTLRTTADTGILKTICPDTDSICFFDIETTGFSRNYNIVYLIGTVYFRDGISHYSQWLAESDSDEAYILTAFNDFLKDFHTLIHFNGDAFDIPFITERAAHLNVVLDLSHLESLDLYKTARKCKSILSLSDYKQKTIEHFLGIEREDMYSGGELIDIYKKFSSRPSDAEHNNYRKLLLLHNHDDIEGMLSLLPLISYYAVIMDSYTIDSTVIDKDTDSDGRAYLRLIAECSLPVSVPVDRHICLDDIHLIIKGCRMTLVVPACSDTMKYFFKDYRNYYYLPSEDEAIHKSIAQYVDSNNRVKCNASNCYAKKTGIFIPVSGTINIPVYKHNYDDSKTFALFDDVFSSDSEIRKLYIQHILNHILGK
ncbi:MAG: ribonuclease H-like domain-containing protein [Eubacteriales bacterium]|nr:ribonuclease H-like domain-containing protein [Eubacteriales bacterium]